MIQATTLPQGGSGITRICTPAGISRASYHRHWHARAPHEEETALHIQPSMSRVGCPWDNAMAESFMRTLIREEVDVRPYRDLAEAQASIGRFIEDIYNGQRLHSALDYLAPAAFEARLPSGCPRTLSLLGPSACIGVHLRHKKG